MGWGRWLLLGDIGQQMDLSDQRAEMEAMRARLARERSEATNTAKRLVQLQDENDELKLYLAAVIRLLLEKNVCTREEIAAMVNAIDKEDGVADGKLHGPLS